MKERKIFLSKNLIVGIAGILFGIAMLVSSGSKSGIYPKVVFACMVFFGVYVIAEMRWKGPGPALDQISVKGLLLIALLFVNPLLGKHLGFYASGFLALLGISAVISFPKSGKEWVKMIVYLFGVTVGIYLVFTVLLRIHTPKGILL